MFENDSDSILEITKELNYSKEILYKAWTEKDRLAKWWGPKGFDINIHKYDFKPGGIFLYSIKSAEGFEIWGRFVFGECVQNEILRFTNSFSNAEGEITRAPFNENWPLEVQNQIIFEEVEGKCILRLSATPVNASPDELNLFKSNFDNIRTGFAGTFEKLENYLITL